MRHGKTFRKRCLTFLLSLAMVLTSVNVPMLTVWAEEETPMENGSGEMLTTPTDDENSDLTAPVEDDEGNEAGEVTTPEDSKEGETTDPAEDDTSPDNDQNPVGEGINPIAEGELTANQDGENDDDEGELVETGETLVSSDIDLTNLAPTVGNIPGTNAGIWSAWTDAGVTAKGEANSTVTFTYPYGRCATDYALQFQTEENIKIAEGEYYTLTFTAESSIPRYMEVCMGYTPANYARYNDLIYKLPAKQKTEVVYVFAAETTTECKIQFLLGTQQNDNSPLWEQKEGHTLKLSNISLVKGKAVAEEGANATVASDSDKIGLKEAIDECEALKAEDYEEESYGALTTALDEAKSVSESAASTKKDVDEALVELQIAQASLHEVGYVPPADPVTMVDPINFEELIEAQTLDAYAGGWGGDSNVQFVFDKTKATISADSFGNQAWTVQLRTYPERPDIYLESSADNNVFEFDVVSTVDKSFVYKNENTQATETIELKAGETAHIARRITGKTFRFTFDLSGGGAGTLTFTNMKFGEEVSFYNFKEQEKAGNVTFYAGNSAVADGTATEDSYTINASNFGSNEIWDVQLILNSFIDIKTNATYKIGAVIESAVDKEITVKLGNPDNPGDELALKKVSLTANTPQTIELESTLWNKELASTLYFACGGGGNSGDIKISKLYFISKKPTAKDAPVLTAGKKNDKANGYRIGEDVELNYNASAEDWADTITAITVNNKTLTSDKYTLSKEDHKITVNAGVFTKYDVYDFVITAENYQDVKVRVPVYAVSVDNEDWKQEWADEFDGTELDSSKWDYEIGIRSGDDATSDATIYWGNNEKQYYTKEAVTVQDGKLVVTATALTDELRSKYNITDDHVKYSSGRIRTVSEDGSKVKFGTTYGRMEAMMELPKATGYWPAFWGLPTPETIDLYGTWAASGELDIMEAVGQDGNYVNGTIHYGSVWPNNVYSGGSHYFEDGDSIEGAHLYAVEWEPGEIRWYVDDILYHVENNWYAKAAGASANYAYPAPFDEDFYLLLNLAVSGNYVSNKEPGEDELGKSMKVDYVRVYKDSMKDYGTTPEAPSVDKDTEFFEANKVHADDSGNYIKDPEFTTLKDHQMAGGTTVVPGLGYWTTATDAANGASSSISVAERDGVKYGKVDVLKQGANNYDIQLIQHVPLAKGYTYKLTFDAYTDVAAGRTFTIAPKGDADNGWVGYDPGINPNLTTEVRSFEHIFTMNAESDPTARIEMNIGNALGTVYVGNAKLVALTDQEIEDLENEKLHGKKTPLENGEHVYNGTFDQGKNRLEYWDLDGDYKADTSKRSMRAVINASSNIDDATIKQTGLQLLARDTYRLTLNVKADAAKEIKVGLYSAEGVVYAQKQETVNTDTGEIILEFTMPEDVTDEEAVLIIAFGGDTVSVEIDNVSMVRTTNFNVKWDASLLYPLGGETWADYYYYVYGNVSEKSVPADGIVTEEANASGENYDYMIFRNVSVKKGYSYDLSFDVKTSVANQKVIASVQQDETWLELAHEEVIAETDWRTVNATFKATTEGAVNLKFLLSDSSNTAYSVNLRNVSLKVAGAPYLELKNLPSKLLVGEKFQVNASHTVEVNPDYEVYIYSSSKPDVATISESGLITAVAAGTTTIKVTSGAGATKSFELTVVANAEEHEGLWIRPISAQTYTGAAIKPEIEVYHNGKLLTIKKDYTVAYKSNTNVGTATVTVTGKGNFKGKDTANFEIVKKDISDEDIIVSDVYAIINKNGKVTNPKVTVKYGKKTLKNNSDYKVTYPELEKDADGKIVAKDYKITISTTAVKKDKKGNSVDSVNYTGEREITYTVCASDIKLMSKATITLTAKSVDYADRANEEKRPAVKTVKFGKEEADLNDFDFAYKDENQAGEATITVTGKDKAKYYGSKSVTYTVNGTKLAANDLTIDGVDEAYDYTGGPIYVSANGGNAGSLKVTRIKGVETPVELEEGKDYEVSYKTGKKLGEHTNVGTVTVTITGINAYTGSINKTFKITAVDLATFVGDDVPTGRKFKAEGKAKYTKTGAKPEITELSFNGTDLVENQDYTVAYAKNNAVVDGRGPATMTIKGKGNFKGQIQHTYEVTKASEADVEVTATDIVKPTKFNKLKTTVKVVEPATGKALKAGTDYEKGIKYYRDEECSEESEITARSFDELLADLQADRAVTVYAKVVMKGNYAGIGETPGSLVAAFNLYDSSKKITDAKKYTIKVVTNQTAAEADINCDTKGNPIYTGSEIEPKVTVTPKGADAAPLVLKKDYVVSYDNNTNKGKATVTVTGIGEYGGTKSLKFTIISADMKWYEEVTEKIATFFSNLF